jgi:hypothetical protein
VRRPRSLHRTWHTMSPHHPVHAGAKQGGGETKSVGDGHGQKHVEDHVHARLVVVVATAVFILNWSPTQSIDDMMPYEVWHGAKPTVHFFHTFGCVAHVKQRSKRLGKLDDRSKPMVFIRYEPGSKAWRFYDPVTKRVHVSRDVIFEEDMP